MSFGKEKTALEAAKLRRKNRRENLKLKLEDKLDRERELRAELEVNLAEIKYLQTRNAKIKNLLLIEEQKNLEVHERIVQKYSGNLCPFCQKEHEKSPPDECWIGAHKIGGQLYRDFDRYLRKNKFGKVEGLE